MTEHDRFEAWIFIDPDLGNRWGAMCGCGTTFGSHESAIDAMDAARPHFERASTHEAGS